MSRIIDYNGFPFTEEILKTMTIDELLILRNKVAYDLHAKIERFFIDDDKAVMVTWKALIKWDETSELQREVLRGKKRPKFARPKVPGEPKRSFGAQELKTPTMYWFQTIKKIREHPGVDFRWLRWNLYTDGMTLAEIYETEGIHHKDVEYWYYYKFMDLIPPTWDEYIERVKAWCNKHNRPMIDLNSKRLKIANNRFLANGNVRQIADDKFLKIFPIPS